ncbi:hypothetical protein ACE6H2_005326 [Prunus campanulata]
MDCCFSGADENTQTNGGNELIFPVYPVLPCRDTMQHSRTNSMQRYNAALKNNSCDLTASFFSVLRLWIKDGIHCLVPTDGKTLEVNDKSSDFLNFEFSIFLM